MTATSERLWGTARKVGDVTVRRSTLPGYPFPFILEFGSLLTVEMKAEAFGGLFADCAAEMDLWDHDQREAAKPPLTEPTSEEDR